jgi:uncharacterized membrane protein YhaH (DUF805 family)
MNWMILPLRRYAEFSGRSRRMEYWMFVLLTLLVNFAFIALMMAVGGGAMFAASSGSDPNPIGVMAAGGAFGVVYLVSLIFGLAMFIPSVAVGVRRLHDTNRSGWWLLAPVLPYVLMLILGFGMLGSMGSGTPSSGIVGGVGIMVMICSLASMVFGVMVFVFMCLDGTRGPNRFGPDPKDPGGDLQSVFS